MRTAVKVAQAALVGSGALVLALGAVIWTGNADQLIGVHVLLGLVLVISLWTLAAISAHSGVRAGIVALAAAWGALVIVLGLVQEALVPGSWHWTIQILHVAVSMGAIWWGRRLVRLIRLAHAADGATPAPRPPGASSALSPTPVTGKRPDVGAPATATTREAVSCGQTGRG